MFIQAKVRSENADKVNKKSMVQMVKCTFISLVDNCSDVSLVRYSITSLRTNNNNRPSPYSDMSSGQWRMWSCYSVTRCYSVTCSNSPRVAVFRPLKFRVIGLCLHAV